MKNIAHPLAAQTRQQVATQTTEHEPGRHQGGVFIRAVLALAILAPLAMGLSWMLAKRFGAANPELSALLTGGLCALGGCVILWGLKPEFHPHRQLGLANAITLLRAGGIAALAGLILAPLSDPGWTLAILATAFLALDGVDGWIARRSGLASRFGARFDMETDVAFALVLAALAWQADKVGAWFLLLGLLRPLYLAGARVWPVLRTPLPPSQRRRTGAGVQMAGQVLILMPVLLPPASTLVGVLLLGGMALSFAVDIHWQVRHASAPR